MVLQLAPSQLNLFINWTRSKTHVLGVSLAATLDLQCKSCFIWSIFHLCELVLQSFKLSIFFVVLSYPMILFLLTYCLIFSPRVVSPTGTNCPKPEYGDHSVHQFFLLWTLNNFILLALFSWIKNSKICILVLILCY